MWSSFITMFTDHLFGFFLSFFPSKYLREREARGRSWKIRGWVIVEGLGVGLVRFLLVFFWLSVYETKRIYRRVGKQRGGHRGVSKQIDSHNGQYHEHTLSTWHPCRSALGFGPWKYTPEIARYLAYLKGITHSMSSQNLTSFVGSRPPLLLPCQVIGGLGVSSYFSPLFSFLFF